MSIYILLGTLSASWWLFTFGPKHVALKLSTIWRFFCKYNQQDETLHDLFISTDALRVSGGSSVHHQELKNCIYSIGYFVKPLLLPATVVQELFHLFLQICEPQPPGNLRVCPGLSWDGCNFLYVYIYFNWHILPKGVSILLFFFLSFWQRSSNSTSKYKGEFPIGTVVTSWYKVRFWRL